MSRLSFILPAYKRRYLADAIRSILAQTFNDFELVVVDDCSPENLHEVVAEFSDARLKYVRNEQNIGGENLVSAWNKAMTYADGEWCVLASDDDVYHPKFVESLLALAERYPQCEVVHCRTGIIDENGNLTKVAEKRPEFESCADLLYARGVKRCLQTVPEFMFKREAFARIGGFISFPLAWYSDDATWLTLASDNGIVCSPDVLFFWRYSGINISSRFDVTAGKIAAGEAYKKWLTGFIAMIRPSSEEDQKVLSYAGNMIQEAVDQQTLFDLDDTKFWLWLKIVMREPMSSRLKLRTMRNRIRKLMHL